MKNNNAEILLIVRDLMQQMISSAQTANWENVSALDKKRTEFLSDLSDTEYTGGLELIDEIIELDQQILELATTAKSQINDKLALASRSRQVHNEYQTIAEL